MDKEKKKLQFLLETLQNNNKYLLHLYFITRHKKKGKFISTIDKYEYKLSRIDLSSEMQGYFKLFLQEQISYVLNKTDTEILEYKIIGDDLENQVYTYTLNKALSFSEIINNKLKNSTDIDPINSLKDIEDSLWAYCVKIVIDEKTVYSFRKLSKGKVDATDKPQNIKEKITTFFDLKDAELRRFTGEIINFDNKVDCIYLDEKFYIFRKSSFEEIVGLEEEYLENAKIIVEALKKTDLVMGIEILEEEVSTSKLLQKTLCSIAKKGNQKYFNTSEIQKMQETIRKFEKRELKTSENGQIIIEDKQDIKDFIKLLNDYYKQGVITGKYYGTNTGEVLTP